MNIIGKKYLYLVISLFILIPGIVSIFIWGLNLSIDFTGGSRISVLLPKNPTQEQISFVRSSLENKGIEINSVAVSDKTIFIRTSQVSNNTNAEFIESLNREIPGVKEQEFETIGPSIGEATTINTLKAIIIASFLIILYISWSFRKVPKPASSLRFGVCAIIALIHDVLLVVGVFSILGHFWGVTIDTMFVTALLTIIGFSVHDTIVVFDRIRENLRKTPNMKFSEIVNFSIIQTLDRSINTSLTVILVLVALLLFGGDTIRWFVVALLIGIVSGTYSSIFNAAPLLVIWQEWASRKRR